MIEAYFDGCCEPINPGGTAAYGMVVLKNGERIFQASKVFIPQPGKEKETSNNVAEYSGFKAILDYLLSEKLQGESIEIFGDSQLVIKQMLGQWHIRQGFYVPIAMECRKMIAKFPRLGLKWIRRDENSLADKLSKAELIRAGVKFRIQPEMR